MVNETTRLLGLDGLAVTEVAIRNESAGQGSIVWLATVDESARCCRVCGVASTRVKEWLTTRPRDLPVAGRTCGCDTLKWPHLEPE